MTSLRIPSNGVTRKASHNASLHQSQHHCIPSVTFIFTSIWKVISDLRVVLTVSMQFHIRRRSHIFWNAIKLIVRLQWRWISSEIVISIEISGQNPENSGVVCAHAHRFWRPILVPTFIVYNPNHNATFRWFHTLLKLSVKLCGIWCNYRRFVTSNNGNLISPLDENLS